MSSNRESSRPSIEEIPLTPTDNDSFSPSSVMRDSIITYTTDLGSSVESMTTGAADDTVIGERKPVRSGQGPSLDFYRRKRFWAICMATSVVLAAIFIPLFFLVIIPSIAQKAINDSELRITSMNVTNPTEDGFDTEMVGESLHAGNFDATLKFAGPLNVIYENQLIGTISTLDPLEISKGRGLLKVPSGKFKIMNFQLFQNFTRDSMTETSFEWTIQGNVKVQTLGITTKILNLNKAIKIPGAGGFSNTTLKDLKVSLNTDQSLHLEMETSINNPSPMGMEIGNLFLQVQYGGTTLANVTSDYFILASGENILTLKGDAKFPTNDVDKNNTIQLIEAFIANRPVNATSKALYTVLKDGVTSGWLNATIQSLTLQTVVGSQPNPPPTIKQVDFGETNLVFTPETAYAPTMTAKGASSGFVSPFDMPFEIETIQQNVAIYFQGKPVIELDTPSLSVTNANSTVTFDLPSTPMKAFDDAHDLFSDFIASLSSQPETDVQLVGKTSIKAKTPLGEFPLNGIPFNIPFKMPGFNLFSQTPKIGNPSIKSIDTSQLVVDVNMTYTNPTKGGMTMGPVNFQLVYQDQQVGTVAIENLTLVPGPSTLNVQITISAPLQNPVFSSYLGGNGSTVYIMGYDGSTNIDSLKKLFSGLKVPAPLPSISSASAATKSALSQLNSNP